MVGRLTHGLTGRRRLPLTSATIAARPGVASEVIDRFLDVVMGQDVAEGIRREAAQPIDQG
jgi:hypothetical protein